MDTPGSADGAPVAGGADGARQRFVSIQYLRAVAALGVVLFHALESSSHRFIVGAGGVDLFFVISGFIMWTVSARERRPAKFAWRRIWRVAPMYWIATLLIAVIAVVRPHFLWRVTPTGAHLLLSLLFVPHLDPYGRLYPLLIQGWTLNYEMVFYAIFAAVLFLPRRRQLLALLACLSALAAIGLALKPAGPAAHAYTDPLLLEFAAGVALARLRERGALASGPAGAALILAGVVLLAVAGRTDLQFDPLRCLYWGVPAAMIVAGAISVEQAGWVRDVRPLSLLGDASYSIYLFHPIVLALVVRALPNAPLWLSAAASLAAASLAGVLVYGLVERPLGRLRGGLIPKWRAAAKPLAASEISAA